tara:strand:- start:1104 stop:1925 length:822 start_codon:yes stop_codon:yes gene_type:complete
MSSCLICGCVKNCEQYLNNVFKNIEQIQKLFEKSRIIISFDISNDFTLKRLIELKKYFDIDIIINKDALTNSRTVNIERARNKILNKIYNEYSDYTYFIMIDMDDVSSKPINVNVLQEVFREDKINIWDGLFFNNANYYDFWALNFKDFQYSCWHSSNVKRLINLMNKEFKQESEGKEFIECQSAFGGFGIYKINRFINCNYRSLIDLTLFNTQSIKNVYEKYGIQYIFNPNIYDCEHRYFNLNAIRQNNVRLFIYNKNLFPPYIGEHTNILQ